MIQVYNTFDELNSSDHYMFNKLYTRDECAYGKAFIVAISYDELFDFSRILPNVEIRYNSKDFTFQDAPEFYGIVLPD